jgi:SAM-dependent methyltransferase
MKSLVSERLSIAYQEDLPRLSKKQLYYRDEVKKALSTKFILVPNPCPCGDHTDSKIIIAEKDRYELPLQSVLCSKCGTVRIDPYLDPQSVATFYKDFYQEMYGRDTEMKNYFERQKQYGKKFYDLAKERLKPNSNILEFGCGAGGALTIFKSAGHSVYGTEYSDKMLGYGRKLGLSNLSFGSLEEFKQLGTGIKFDLIYSNHVFEHVNKPHECLRNCIELLKDDGSLICAIPDIYNIHRPEYIFPNCDLKPMLHIAHIYNYSFGGLEKMAASLGAGITRLFPDPSMITPTSTMPEIWFRIYKVRSQEKTNNQVITESAFDFLGYFRETENRYQSQEKTVQPSEPIMKKLKEKVKQLIHWKK